MGPADRELFLAQLATLMEDEAEGATPQASVAAGSLCGVAHLWAQVHSPMQAPNVNAAFFKPDLGAYSQLGGGAEFDLVTPHQLSKSAAARHMGL